MPAPPPFPTAAREVHEPCGKATGLSVQPGQKYETGHNRLTASRIAEVADPSSTAFEAGEALGVSARTFYSCFPGGRSSLTDANTR
jgi:hypothetical protein